MSEESQKDPGESYSEIATPTCSIGEFWRITQDGSTKPTKLLPHHYRITKVQFGVVVEEEYVFHGAEYLEKFAATKPFGDTFTLKISGYYRTYPSHNEPNCKAAYEARIKELTGVGF